MPTTTILTNLDLAPSPEPNGAATAATLRFFEDAADGAHYVALRAPAALASNVSYVFPSAQGAASTVLQNDGSGNLSWASGFSGGTVSGAVNFTGQFAMGGILTTTTLNANTNNWNPAGMSTANILRISSSLSINLTGIQAPSPAVNQLFFVYNVGVDQIAFVDNSGLSLAGNRFLFGNNRTLQANEGLMLWYDVLSAGWRSPGIQL